MSDRDKFCNSCTVYDAPEQCSSVLCGPELAPTWCDTCIILEIARLRRDSEDLRWIENKLEAAGADLREAIGYLMDAEERACAARDELPEWISCIQKDDLVTYCGRHHNGFGWMFQGRDHAVRTVLNGDRMQPCGHCMLLSEGEE